MQQERSTSDARTLRLHQVQDQLDRDHGVGRGTAAFQDLIAGFHRQRVGGGDHEVLRCHQFPLGATGGLFRLGVLSQGAERHRCDRSGQRQGAGNAQFVPQDMHGRLSP